MVNGLKRWRKYFLVSSLLVSLFLLISLIIAESNHIIHCDISDISHIRALTLSSEFIAYLLFLFGNLYDFSVLYEYSWRNWKWLTQNKSTINPKNVEQMWLRNKWMEIGNIERVLGSWRFLYMFYVSKIS